MVPGTNDKGKRHRAMPSVTVSNNQNQRETRIAFNNLLWSLDPRTNVKIKCQKSAVVYFNGYRMQCNMHDTLEAQENALRIEARETIGTSRGSPRVEAVDGSPRRGRGKIRLRSRRSGIA